MFCYDKLRCTLRCFVVFKCHGHAVVLLYHNTGTWIWDPHATSTIPNRLFSKCCMYYLIYSKFTKEYLLQALYFAKNVNVTADWILCDNCISDHNNFKLTCNHELLLLKSPTGIMKIGILYIFLCIAHLLGKVFYFPLQYSWTGLLTKFFQPEKKYFQCTPWFITLPIFLIFWTL